MVSRAVSLGCPSGSGGDTLGPGATGLYTLRAIGISMAPLISHSNAVYITFRIAATTLAG